MEETIHNSNKEEGWLKGFSLFKKNSGITKNPFCCQREGLTIRGTEYRPIGECLPAAIVCHGFMAFQDSVKHYATILASMGYVAYTFDFCGGCVIKGKSDGKTTDMSVLTETRDLESVLEYVQNRPYVNAKELIVMGCSQGGFVAALVAAKATYPISKLVLFYPAFCIPDDARAGKMMFARFDPANIPTTFRCGPMKLGKCYAEDVLKMDPFESICGFDGDVLIVHGTKDGIVDLRYSKRAYEVYKGEGKSRRVLLEEIANGGHGFSKRYDAVAIGKLQDFLG